jgi:ribosomal protein S18 acetylase RimI-like enzyme
MTEPLGIRPCTPEEIDACLRLRAEAFIQIFHAEIGPQAVAAGVTAYPPSRMAALMEEMPCHVVAREERVVGFLLPQRLDATTVEIVMLYIDPDHVRRGIGARLLRHLETWLREHEPTVTRLVLDTIIPRYNQAFYERMGFAATGRSCCAYHALRVPAVRLEKRVGHAAPTAPPVTGSASRHGDLRRDA